MEWDGHGDQEGTKLTVYKDVLYSSTLAVQTEGGLQSSDHC